MKRILILVVLILMLPVLVSNLYSLTIEGSAHDLSTGGLMLDRSTDETRICVFCHTPHGSDITEGQPLWNRTNSLSTFTVYTSATFDATALDIAPGPNASMQCMSCHDGTVAVNSLINPSNEFPAGPTMGSGDELDATGKLSNSLALLGTDLRDDHPVNFLYSDSYTADGPSNLNRNLAVSNLLFNDRVQCASCHDVHNNQYEPFLTVNPAQSQLCLVCHNK